MSDKTKSEWWKPVVLGVSLTAMLGMGVWGLNSQVGGIHAEVIAIHQEVQAIHQDVKDLTHIVSDHQDRIVRLETEDGITHLRSRHGTVAPYRRLHE